MSVTRREFVKTVIVAAGSASTARVSHAFAAQPTASFSTEGHTVYHLHPAKVNDSAEPVVIAACYDGAVLCYTASGRRLWSTQAGDYFPFDLCVADIDNDGLDEALVASGDGTLYAIDHDGKPLWTFQKRPPLFQVSTAKLPSGESVILTGGVEQVLYQLSATGKLLRQLPTEYCIRHIRSGNIRDDGKDYFAVCLAQSGLMGELSLLLINPANLISLWRKDHIGTLVPNSGKRFFSMAIMDVDHDGKEEIILSDSWAHGRITAFNYDGKQIWSKFDPQLPFIPYRMNLLSPVRLPKEEYIFGIFANMLLIYDTNGTLHETLTSRYAFANAAFDPATRTYWLGSGTSGGDDLHCLHLDRAGWKTSFKRTRPIGKLARIERNMETLREQVAQFRAPAYQPTTNNATVLLLDEFNELLPEAQRPYTMQYRNVRFVAQMTRLALHADGLPMPPRANSAVMVCQKLDDSWNPAVGFEAQRQSYDLSADQIVNAARNWENQGKDFLMGAAHGAAPFMPLSTMERVLQVAPKHLWGFGLEEMEGTSKRMQDFVDQVLIPLAEMCRRYGSKKIIFRNKNIFWSGNSYLPFWSHVLLDSKYKDVFVPDSEDTNSRTQELSFSGRVGLWMAGAFDSWGCRVETDNACFDRMREWSSQQVLSHHFRQMVSRASYGAEIHYNSIHQGIFSKALLQQVFPFYDMLEKGIVHIPKPDELLSVSDVCLGMRTPAAEYVKHGVNGHRYDYPQEKDAPAMVFDRLDCYWAGSPIAQHDFSHYAYGLRRRMTNFLPALPYGLVAIVPDADKAQGGKRFTRKISTDGMYFYDEHGGQHTAAEYKPVVQQALTHAAERLPIAVRGNVHWTAARLDPHHVRITLIDPGYVDPNDREAEILFQNLNASGCIDILSGKEVPIKQHAARIHVPAGALRILDVAHQQT